MNALEYEKRYHNLVVSLDGQGTTTVNVRRYQINREDFKNNLLHGNREALKHKDQLFGRMVIQIAQLEQAVAAAEKQLKADIKDGYARFPSLAEHIEEYGSEGVAIHVKETSGVTAGAWSKFNAARAVHTSNAEVLRQFIPKLMDLHSGKGSPEEIAQALLLVARYKLYDKAFATDPAAGVRDYCDKYIGLDCNGFVGNYARALGKAKVPNTEIPFYAKPERDRRTRIEDVEADDVLVWTDFGHIAVIHSIGLVTTGPDGKPARDCVVVESTPANPSGTAQEGGLQHSTYSIRAVTNKVFAVERPKGGFRNSVYIAPLA